MRKIKQDSEAVHAKERKVDDFNSFAMWVNDWFGEPFFLPTDTGGITQNMKCQLTTDAVMQQYKNYLKKNNMIDTILSEIQVKGWYRKWKIEKDFQTEIFQNLRKKNFFCYHIADVWYTYKMLDWYIFSTTTPHMWIEFKKIDLHSFNIKQFEESQIELMKRFNLAGVPYRIMIYSVRNNDFKVFNNIDTLLEMAKNGWIKLFT